MSSVKTIKIDKPMPENIRKALDKKRERMEKIRNGEIDLSKLKPIKRVV